MKPCLSNVTTLPTAFADDVHAYADAGGTAMEVWLTKLEEHLQKSSVSATKQLLAEREMQLVAAAYQGGLLLSQGQQRREMYDQFQRRLALCQEFGIEVLTILADFVEKVSPQDFARAQVSLQQAAQLAASFQVKLALEFRSTAKLCASLDTAAALVAACEEPNLGLTLDLFHYYTGPSKFEDLGHLHPGNLFLVQVCDLAGVPRELATDADRILPGEGDFQLPPILDHLRRIGYAGYVTVELMNPDLWQMKPLAVAEAALTGLRRLLGLAEMGPGLTRGQEVRV
jgi:sugar phosphate isomerase/epimerase